MMSFCFKELAVQLSLPVALGSVFTRIGCVMDGMTAQMEQMSTTALTLLTLLSVRKSIF